MADNKITFAYNYYNTPSAVPRSIERWRSYSDFVKQNLSIVLVDDGSSSKIAPIVSPHKAEIGIPIDVYEIEEDIPWNACGAGNLAMKMAKTDWVFKIDIDWLVSNEILEVLMKKQLDRNTFYTFDSIDSDTKLKLNSGPNLLLLTRDLFWSSGGYDEDFRGNYGYDDTWLWHRMRGYGAKHQHLNMYLEAIMRASQEHKLGRDTAINERLLEKKVKGEIPLSCERFRFKWSQREI